MKRKYKVAVALSDDNYFFSLLDSLSKRKDFNFIFLEKIKNIFPSLGRRSFDLLLVDMAHLSSVTPLILERGIYAPPLMVIADNIVSLELDDCPPCIVDFLCPPFTENEFFFRAKLLIHNQSELLAVVEEKRELELLLEMSQLLSSTLHSRELLRNFVSHLSRIFRLERCSIIRVEPEEGRATIIVSQDNPEVEGMCLSLEKYPEVRRAIETKKIAFVRDVRKDRLMESVLDKFPDRKPMSILVVPLMVGKTGLGTLLLRGRKVRQLFTEREARVFAALANIACQVLLNASLYETLEKTHTKLEKLAITDSLTGACNRMYLYSRLEEEFYQAVRYRHPLSCLMLDIDNFKEVNDRFGHLVGDAVLREFVMFIKGNIRKADLFARYGGDEFVILMPHIDLRGALRNADRIRKKTAEHIFLEKEERVKVTLSIGASSIGGVTLSNPEDLLNSADAALLEAKRRGGDQIVPYDANMC